MRFCHKVIAKTGYAVKTSTLNTETGDHAMRFPIWVGYVFERFPILSNLYLVTYAKEPTSETTQYANFQWRKKATGTYPHLKAITGALLHDIFNPLRMIDATIETARRLMWFLFSPVYTLYLRVYSVEKPEHGQGGFVFHLRHSAFPPIFNSERWFVNGLMQVLALPSFIIAQGMQLVDILAKISLDFIGRLYLAAPYPFLGKTFKEYEKTPIIEPKGLWFRAFYKKHEIEAGDSEKNQIDAPWLTETVVSAFDTLNDKRKQENSTKSMRDIFDEESHSGKITHKPGLIYFLADLPYQLLKKVLQKHKIIDSDLPVNEIKNNAAIAQSNSNESGKPIQDVSQLSEQAREALLAQKAPIISFEQQQAIDEYNEGDFLRALRKGEIDYTYRPVGGETQALTLKHQ